MSENLENSAVARGLENVSLHSNPKERQCQECLNYHTLALISRVSKVMLKIFQARLQQYTNQEFPDVLTGFRKARGTRDQIGHIHSFIRKQGNSRKTSTSASWNMQKPLAVWITTNWKVLKEMGIPNHSICQLRNLYVSQ